MKDDCERSSVYCYCRYIVFIQLFYILSEHNNHKNNILAEH